MAFNMTFKNEGDYVICYINGKEVSRTKKVDSGSSEEEIVDIINDQIKANPEMVGDEPNLEGLEVVGDKYTVPQGGGATLDDIVDSSGNKRFVEGNGENTTVSSITTIYNKWSLSGTHLMCVVVLKTGSSNISTNDILAEYVLPDFIINKIVAATDGTGIVCNLYPMQNLRIAVVKANGKISFMNYGTLYANSQYRIQCDLLIDTE